MQLFITLAAVVAVAVAVPVQRELVAPGLAGPAPIVDEDGSPIAIGPAILDLSPVSVGPAIVETSPVSIGPAIVDIGSPITIGPAINDIGSPITIGPAINDIVLPTPAVITPVAPAAESTPFVQIILNINQAAAGSAPVGVSPVIVDQVAEEVYVPGPVNVVDNVVIEPEQVVEPVIVEPEQVVEPIVVEPVQVVEPIVVEPVQVGTPVLPAPAVVIPGTMN